MNIARTFAIVIVAACGFAGARAAEIRLQVAPTITLPTGVPKYQEDLTGFYGTNVDLVTSSFLRQRVFNGGDKDLTEAATAGIVLGATHEEGTSIILLTATGTDDPLCKKYLAALAGEFLSYEAEKKKRYYAEAIDRATAAMKAAEKEPAIYNMLNEYFNGLRVAAALDTRPEFEIIPEK